MQSRERHTGSELQSIPAELSAIRLGTPAKQSRYMEQISESSINSDEDFSMKLAFPMPSQVMVGRKMKVPIIILFNRPSVAGAFLGSDDVWVYASLLDARSNSIAQEDLLGGQRAGSVHPLQSGSAAGGDAAYASLPHLVFSISGRYRLRLTAIDMKHSQQGRVLATITSEVFEVVDKAENFQTNGDLTAALRCVQELGIQL